MSTWADTASWSSDATNWNTATKSNSVSFGVTGDYSSISNRLFDSSITLVTSFGDPSSWASDSASWDSDSSVWRTGFLADATALFNTSVSLGITEDFTESEKLTIQGSGTFGISHDYITFIVYNSINSISFDISSDTTTLGNTTYPVTASFPITENYVANVNHSETATFSFNHDYANASSFLWTTMTESSDTWTTVTESSDLWTEQTEDSGTWTSVH